MAKTVEFRGNLHRKLAGPAKDGKRRSNPTCLSSTRIIICGTASSGAGI